MVVKKLYRELICVYLCLLAVASADAQTDTLGFTLLDSIEIHAYAAKNLLNHTASINYISRADLNRYSGNHILPAVNAGPGVRMEERSPGSYRLNIRGSSVRSPYGVRNVKIYFNHLPFTAPGGASMLNMLGGTQVDAVEIIKGPAGSMYGAGSGGVLLLRSSAQPLGNAIGFKAGSDGLLGIDATAQLKSQRFQIEHQKYDGYRDHTAMHRSNAGWEGNWKLTPQRKMQAILLYTDLFYETPGALTQNEYLFNPKAARPASPVFPGAETAKASIHQESLLAGITHEIQGAPHWKNTSSLYALFNRTENPTVQNFEKKREPHYGARSDFSYDFHFGHSFFTLHAGVEYQQGDFKYKTYTNQAGRADSLHTQEALKLRQGMLFTQLDWKYKKWQINLGSSYSAIRMQMDRTAASLLDDANKALNAFVPRLALGFKPIPYMAIYLNVAEGFSPPAADEIFADNNSYNLSLKAEKSRNIEFGIRGTVFKKSLEFDLSYFQSDIKNGIVTRRDSGGGNYFVNAGLLEQSGFEGQIGYWVFNNPKKLFSALKLRASYSNYVFKYKEFLQSGNDFSGNQLPGVAPQNVTLLADMYMLRSFALFATYAYTGTIALNDANTAFADGYSLFGLKITYTQNIHTWKMTIFGGADNLGDVRYSLGNDINGFGGRYFNLAPGRNFYGGFRIEMP